MSRGWDGIGDSIPLELAVGKRARKSTQRSQQGIELHENVIERRVLRMTRAHRSGAMAGRAAGAAAEIEIGPSSREARSGP